MDSYVDRLQNQSYIYFKYLLTSEDTFPLPLAFPPSSSSIFFYHTSPCAAFWTVSRGSISWHLIPVTLSLLTPNTSGIHVEGCWMSKKECCLPPGQKQKKERGLSTEVFGSAEVKQHIFCFWKMFRLQLFFCIIWYLNQNLTNV